MQADARRAVIEEERRRIPQERVPAARVQVVHPTRVRPDAKGLGSGTRRQFLQTMVAALGALGLWIMNRMAWRAESIPELSETTRTVPWSAADTIRFYDRMIVINSSAEVGVFSSSCTHLGCRINRVEGAELVCPCHGSRFNLRGEAVHGPASHGLRPLPFVLDRARSVLHVTLENQ